MILCTWNIRGLNNPLEVGEIKKFLGVNKATCFSILETRVKNHNKEKIMMKFWN